MVTCNDYGDHLWKHQFCNRVQLFDGLKKDGPEMMGLDHCDARWHEGVNFTFTNVCQILEEWSPLLHNTDTTEI